jgi:hypothetical protein
VSLVVAWLAFPLLLSVLAFGCGLLVRRIAGLDVPAALIPPLGLATIIVVGQLSTSFGATAKLTSPLVVVVAVTGLVVSRGDIRSSLPARPELVAAIAVYVVLAVPIVALGEATIAGYLKLEDGSTFLALADSALERGRGLDGYTGSGYLIIYNPNGDYPVGGLLPFAIGGRLLGEEIAWLLQPYLALLAAMLALALQPLSASLITSPWRRALVAFVTAQAALLFGFAMWGGLKELTAAWLIPLAAALLPPAARASAGWRSVVPLAITTGATIATLSFGALAWLGVPFAVAFVLMVRSSGLRTSLTRAAAFALVSVPILLTVLPTAGIVTNSGNRAVLTSQEDLGTLLHPLNLLQAAGVWLTSDFRLSPDYPLATTAVIVLVLATAVAGAVDFWRNDGRAALLYAAGAITGCIAIVSRASPWVDAKALATISAVPVFLAMSAGARATEAGRRIAGWCVIGIVAVGVLASNALAYREVTLAPRDRFEELDRIDRIFAGRGPTLLTREDVYANRYFLRDMAVDNAAENRWHHPISLRDGRPIKTFRSVDIDQLSADTVGHYRLLVLRRSPVGSRPPSNFELAWRGRWYDVWRQTGPMPKAHLALGSRFDAGDTPACSTLRLFADRDTGGDLVAARAPDAVVVDLPAGRLPGGWRARKRFPGAALASRSGTVETTFELPHGGRWQLWVGGAVLGHLSVTIDDRQVATVRHRMNRPGEYEPLAVVALGRGTHRLEFDYRERLLDGINDRFLMGPVALTPAGALVEPTVLRAGDVDSLCGEHLDWVEAIPGS